MGVVHEAADEDGQICALKLLSAGADGGSPESRRRFLREAKSTMALRHPHIVKVRGVEIDEESQQLYLVMERLVGASLDVWLRKLGPLPPAIVCRIALEACGGLGAAHEAGIIHRDIKPANLFLHQRSEREVEVKVCDFGVAKRLDQDGGASSTSLTGNRGLIGSPLYMSPEQARNAPTIDGRSDIWSLCLTMYEALVGERPWQGHHSVGDLILAICTRDLTPIRRVAPWVPAALAQIVHQGLRREPSERWGSIDELARQLEAFAAPPLSLAGLRPLTPEERAGLDEAERSFGGATADPEAFRPAGRLPRLAPRRLLALGLAVGGLGVLGQLARPARAVTGAAPATSSALALSAAAPPPGSAAPLSVQATLEIWPPEARVWVAGQASPVQAPGLVVLRGEAGDGLDVVIERGDQRIEARVWLGKDGSVHPSRLALPAVAVTPAAPQSASGAAQAVPRATRIAAPGRATTEVGTRPAAPAVAPAQASSARPGLKTSFD
jgi:serine/threonine-protein kinase